MASTPAHVRVSAEPIQRLANSYGIANLMVHLNATHEAWSIEQEYQAYITEYQGEGVIPILPDRSSVSNYLLKLTSGKQIEISYTSHHGNRLLTHTGLISFLQTSLLVKQWDRHKKEEPY